MLVTVSGTLIVAACSLRSDERGHEVTDAGADTIPDAVSPSDASPDGDASPDADSVSITDPLDSTTLSYYVTGGVTFTQGTTTSALALGAVTYSNTAAPGPYIYTYTPVADGNGYDATVTSLKVATTGTFAYGGAPAPSFTLKFRVKIK